MFASDTGPMVRGTNHEKRPDNRNQSDPPGDRRRACRSKVDPLHSGLEPMP